MTAVHGNDDLNEEGDKDCNVKNFLKTQKFIEIIEKELFMFMGIIVINTNKRNLQTNLQINVTFQSKVSFIPMKSNR